MSAPGRPPTRRRGVHPAAHGEPWTWLMAGALLICLAMVGGLLVFVAWQGAATFWPREVLSHQLVDGREVLGPVVVRERRPLDQAGLADLPDAEQQRLRAAAQEGGLARRLVRSGNDDLSASHYEWLDEHELAEVTRPAWAVLVERVSWGRLYGRLAGFLIDGELVTDEPAAAWALWREHHPPARERRLEQTRLERGELGALNAALRDLELDVKVAEQRHGAAPAELLERLARQRALSDERAAALTERVAALRKENARYALRVAVTDGPPVDVPLGDVVRALLPNQLDGSGRLGVYLSRWWEFLWDGPREGNTEGGVYPALFGTVLMTLLMTLLVVPLGVLAALYLREYARQGLVVGLVRVAVNNLAGVPSIVFGVFGLGFFCYVVGGFLDDVVPRYAADQPNPTFGKGGLLWAACTLALLTLPVVIVATEEALAAVPGSLREGSFACGATRWQTLRRIVLPRAAPGIMTGMILALARGAGEVAPLMLVGAVKFVDKLPVDWSRLDGSLGPLPTGPLHLERSFMHLGYHVFDLGFHSPNSEAARPMVFTTTLLLIGLVVTLNLLAVWIRARLRRRLEGVPL